MKKYRLERRGQIEVKKSHGIVFHDPQECITTAAILPILEICLVAQRLLFYAPTFCMSWVSVPGWKMNDIMGLIINFLFAVFMPYILSFGQQEFDSIIKNCRWLLKISLKCLKAMLIILNLGLNELLSEMVSSLSN